jgi:hypothetical protein
MKLPNFENAKIEVEKLTEYCLNENHPVGKHKARLFKNILGITIENANVLIDIILHGIRIYPVEERDADQYGKRYTVDIQIAGINENITLRTNWILKTNEDFPRLTSCFIKI